MIALASSLRRTALVLGLGGVLLLGSNATALAQAVCLPAPRLLTTKPMGGQVGTEVEITITGQHLENVEQLVFSDPRITAVPKLDDAGQPVPDTYVVTIAEDCPVGIYEARAFTRLGLSSARIFSVGSLPEGQQTQPNTSLETAMLLQVGSVCNAVMTVRAVDHYAFEAQKDQRIIIDCAARGIDSKLEPVVTVATAAGRDLVVERTGDVIDFVAPETGRYVIKIHDLTYRGGPECFYRLGLWELPAEAPVVRQPSTSAVNAFSWPPVGLPEQAALTEAEPNNGHAQAQKITLPCDIAGSFFPAADVDVYEFEAKKGEQWWIEVASDRLGRPTDPAVLVQLVTGSGDEEVRTDVAEFNDIPSPVKVSSNGYAYDGPPYNAGTADVLGKLEIPQDGRYRLQITDLFGGTRNDARNVYRLVIRKAEPDFALVAWALHMELRNGDRNALSKPIALRGGATMALEVIAMRRDGFDGDIELSMDGLPEGVTACGLKIPAGQSRGLMLVTAREDAPHDMARVTFVGRGTINGEEVVRPVRLASVSWPIPDSWGEIPSPRLVADVPVSVAQSDYAPITITPEQPVYEVTAGQSLTIPLKHIVRSEFSGATMQLKTMGAGFERVPAFNAPLSAEGSKAVIDLAALKTAPGEYSIAFYGSAVAKYRHNPAAVTIAEELRLEAERRVKELEAEAKQLAEAAQAATEEAKPAAEAALAEIAERQKAAAAALAAATEEVKRATEAAAPRDIVDIVVSEPITIRVKAAE